MRNDSMPKIDEIIQACISDRTIAFEDSTIGFVKKHNIDLSVKILVLLLNSFKRGKYCKYVFVDEVKNSNMANNLEETERVFKKRVSIRKLSFYNFNKHGSIVPHKKLLSYIWRIIWKTIACTVISIWNKEKSEKILLSTIGLTFIDYIKQDGIDDTWFVLMSDYHFFSSILAMVWPKKCFVLQHGLKIDDTLCYPIRADYYLAWGERSKSLLYNDPKVIITGTYKYREIKSTPKDECFTVLFCIGSRDMDRVLEKIDATIAAFKDIKHRLIIKCHPGSLYSDRILIDKYRNQNIRIEKESLLQDIPFSLAVTESSTAIMDFVALKKPFIVYDTGMSYFSAYKNIIPTVRNEEELCLLANRINDIDFEKINQILITEELNNGNCNIFETINGITESGKA